MVRKQLSVALAVASTLGVGLIVLQRWVAQTRWAAIALVAIWFALVGVAVVAVSLRRPRWRLPALGTYLAVAVVSAGIGYWTAFRDHPVNETVVMASEQASGLEKIAGLDPSRVSPPLRRGPVRIVSGRFTGRDGHAGRGVATVVRTPGGGRKLTFTRFRVDPGVQVEVYLTKDDSSVGDRIELGGLKGNVGNQQYSIPKSADLSTYDTVMLYCVPFTVRIATAPLA